MTTRVLATGALTILGVACSTACVRSVAAPAAQRSVRAVLLPGATSDGVSMDYLAYDPVHHRVWVPAGNTASVDVLDVATGETSRIEGFPTAKVERRGEKRTVGPSSVTVGENVVYVGNRGDSSVSAIDASSLAVEARVALKSMPDGLAYVASTKEVWVTTPRDRSITVLGVEGGDLTRKAAIPLDGQPEGFAVDDRRGRFYTNLEDTDRTLVIDVRSRRVTSTWHAGCGADGPRGLALDAQLDLLLVACTDRVRVLDAGHDGTPLGLIATGDGLDNIDYVASRHELYAAAARSATLTIARLDPHGGLAPVALVPTVPGARNAVATEEGIAYVADSSGGKLLVVAPVAAP